MNVSWREHSFLDNPRCPESVKRSKLTIYSSTVSASDNFAALHWVAMLGLQEREWGLPPGLVVVSCGMVSHSSLAR